MVEGRYQSLINSYSMYGLEMKQVGTTEAYSQSWGARDGKWNNFFTANIETTNGSLEIAEITEIQGEYQNAGN